MDDIKEGSDPYEAFYDENLFSYFKLYPEQIKTLKKLRQIRLNHFKSNYRKVFKFINEQKKFNTDNKE